MRTLVLFAGAVLWAGCAGGGSGSNPAAAARILIQSGSGVAQVVGRALPAPLRARVLNAAGAGLLNVVVRFEIVEGDGVLGAISTSTDAAGVAQAGLTLGRTAGPLRVTATVTSAPQLQVTFVITALPDIPVRLKVVSGDGQAGDAGQALPATIVVEALDLYGNAVSNHDFNVQTMQGDGSPQAGVIRTDANGRLSILYTVGNGIEKERVRIFNPNDASIRTEFEADVRNYALEFGETDVVFVPAHGSLVLTELTVEAWVYVLPGPSANPRRSILSLWDGNAAVATNCCPWQLSISDDVDGFDKPEFEIGAAASRFVGPSATPDEAWVHLAGSYDGATMRLYVNGALAATQAHAGGIHDGQIPVRFGNNWNDEGFLGRIDEVRIWNYARNIGEIDADRGRSLTGNEPGLVGYWRFNDSSGQTVADSGPNANHGTLGETSAPGSDEPSRTEQAAPITPE